MLLKLAFSKRLAYSREKGFRTAKFSLPFKVLGQFLGCEREMARPAVFEQIDALPGAQHHGALRYRHAEADLRQRRLDMRRHVIRAPPAYG